MSKTKLLLILTLLVCAWSCTKNETALSSKEQFNETQIDIGFQVKTQKNNIMPISDDNPLKKLEIFQGNYPQVFVFRKSEQINDKTNYEEWEEENTMLMGIMGKVLPEELKNVSKNRMAFFASFKQKHPNKMVVLHYNHEARDPAFGASSFFDGHWIYHVGSIGFTDMPSQDEVTEIKVGDVGKFSMNNGFYRNKPDDIGICRLDESGKPDWSYAEQVVLLSINEKKGTILVKRGMYGSSKKSFLAGNIYIAPHLTQGPWGKDWNNLMWHYNYSTACPKDKEGKTAYERHAEELSQRFIKGGELEAFDGIQFDVASYVVGRKGGPQAKRPIDINADSKQDEGFFGGVQTFGAGVTLFFKELKNQMPDNKLILADATYKEGQRATSYINGIESEGFPYLTDWEAKGYNSGLNMHMFWKNGNTSMPYLSYFTHKYTKGEFDSKSQKLKRSVARTPEDVPWSIHRLVFAAAVFVDAAFCAGLLPPGGSNSNDIEGSSERSIKAESPSQKGWNDIWDEFKKGEEQQIGWLGKALSPTIRLALGKPTTFSLNKANSQLLQANEGSNTQWRNHGLGITGSANAPTGFKLNLAVDKHLVVCLSAKGIAMKGQHESCPRVIKVTCQETKETQESWVNNSLFESVFAFNTGKLKKATLLFEFEGIAPVNIQKLQTFEHPDIIYRVFENGLVIANNSDNDFKVDLSNLLYTTGKQYRRIKASKWQDKAVNNGQNVGNELIIPARDALFLQTL